MQMSHEEMMSEYIEKLYIELEYLKGAKEELEGEIKVYEELYRKTYVAN